MSANILYDHMYSIVRNLICNTKQTPRCNMMLESEYRVSWTAAKVDTLSYSDLSRVAASPTCWQWQRRPVHLISRAASSD